MNGYTETAGTSGGWADVITSALNAYAGIEQAKYNAKQSEAFSEVWRYQDAQAKAASYTQTADSASMVRNMIMLAGVGVAGFLIYKLIK